MTARRKTIVFLLLLTVVVLDAAGLLATVLYYAFIVGAILAALIISFFAAVSVSVTEDDVYAVLSSVNWKTVVEMEKELRNLKHITQPWRQITGLRKHLDSLALSGLVETRDRELSPEQLQAREGIPQPEFRKTSQNMRHRHRRRIFLLLPAIDAV